ncbi:Helix-turn-helix domain-containing protein [Paenibacillus sp. UNCCL117]|uniref:helix-turn-helix domain-containing protein n=1 Tax=unclassified Paenibacillus TaxID=185978 RepID=UPI00088DA5B3|nr:MULTISPECIES: helix-turn-helix domain-containing protein [unclassified Paenibacillus]SDD38302.1 Helix-turn-helix domain-containing protein [Paenibacillus sp. cl123]SFW48607.1 Helix-turn-helix domain-containing protein [Paenibacillus sp. UNCCL117]
MRSLSFLSKMTLFGFLLSTLPVVFIGFFAYVTSSNEIQKNANKGSMQLIQQINTNVEHKLTTVNHTLNQVLNSTVLKKALTAPLAENDFMTYDDLRKEIRYMQSFDTRVEDVLLLNQQQNWMIKNSGLYRLDSYQYREQLESLMNVQEQTPWMLTPSAWFHSEENARSLSCDYSISLVKKLPTTGLEKYGLAAANIPACSLQEFMPPVDDSTGSIVILDDRGRLLLHPDHSLIGMPLEEAGMPLAKLLAPGDSGQFKTVLASKPYSVTYLRSQLTGWTYMSITSIQSLTAQSGKIGLYTIYVCLLMLLLSMLLAWFGSRRMYSPIQVLLNQIGARLQDKRARQGSADEFQLIGEQVAHLFQSKSRLEQEVQQHVQQVRTFFLIKLFQGKVKQSELEENLEQFGYGVHSRSWASMAVITLQIDSIDNTRYERRDLDLLLFAIHNIIEELVPPEGRFVPVTIDQTVVMLVGSPESNPETFRSSVYAMTENLQRQISSYLNLQVSIGMSLPIHAISAVPIAYREGLEALKHRIKLGEGIIIQYENLNAGRHYLNLNYPKQLENELLDAVKLADLEKSKELLKQLLHTVFSVELTPQEYQIPLARLLNNLLIAMQESGIGMHQIRSSQDSLFEELFGLSIASEIEDWFWGSVIRPMAAIFRDRQEEQYHNISEKIIDLVQHGYSTDMTLEECASRLHYNANYLSSIFRKETGYSFSEYLIMYRFSMAKKWLAETDMPIKDIAEKLRYTNPQNFIRSFRKQEGMTPGQYRTKHTAAVQ